MSLSNPNSTNVHGCQERWDEEAECYEKTIRHKASADFTIMAARYSLTKVLQLRSENLSDYHDTAATLHMLSLCHHQLEYLNDVREFSLRKYDRQAVDVYKRLQAFYMRLFKF